MEYKILIADDDLELVKMLRTFFELRKYLVITAADGRETLKKVEIGPDIILLDINMPRIDGIEVCRRIRDKVSCPILFLTARVDEQDRVNGLMSGGDDYITKPFSIDELGVRVMAHLRREKRGRQSKKESEETKGFRIRYDERSVRFDGEEIRLTKTEFDILEFLSMHPRQVFSKEQIYEAVRGLEGNGDNSIVTEHIRRLRGKIAQKTKEDYIETVWGVGYKWIG